MLGCHFRGGLESSECRSQRCSLSRTVDLSATVETTWNKNEKSLISDLLGYEMEGVALKMLANGNLRMQDRGGERRARLRGNCRSGLG